MTRPASSLPRIAELCLSAVGVCIAARPPPARATLVAARSHRTVAPDSGSSTAPRRPTGRPAARAHCSYHPEPGPSSTPAASPFAFWIFDLQRARRAGRCIALRHYSAVECNAQKQSCPITERSTTNARSWESARRQGRPSECWEWLASNLGARGPDRRHRSRDACKARCTRPPCRG